MIFSNFKLFKFNLNNSKKNGIDYLFCFLVLFFIFNFYRLSSRILYAADLTDEAFYASLFKSFHSGFKPYVDELLLVQSFGVIGKILYSIYNQSDLNIGFILFLRICYFFALLASCWHFFHALRYYCKNEFLLISSIFIISYWPFSIPTFSYNTISFLCIFNSFLILIDLDRKKYLSYKFLLAVVFLTIAAFCYPTLSPIAFILLVHFVVKNFQLVRSKYLFTSTITFLVLISLFSCHYFLFVIGKDRLLEIWNYSNSYNFQGGGLSKFLKIFGQFKENSKFLLIFFLIPLSLVLYRKHVLLSAIASLLFAYFVIKFPTYKITLPPFHISILGLSLSLFIPFLLDFRKTKDLIKWIPLYSILSGILYSWTSGNGLTNFSVSGTIVVISLAYFLSTFSAGIAENSLRRIVILIIPISFGTFQLRETMISVYGDEYDQSKMTKTIPKGPYKGIRTTDFKWNFLENLEADIKIYSQNMRSIAFLDSFAYGYLFTDLTIKSPTIWPYSLSQIKYDRNKIFEYFNIKNNQPDLIFWQKEIPIMEAMKVTLESHVDDPVHDLIEKTYSRAKETRFYIVYIKRETSLN